MKHKSKELADKWDRVPGSELLKSWSEEIKIALKKGDEVEWRQVGRAVVLISSDDYRSKLAAECIAQECNLKFLSVDADDVFDLPPHNNFLSNAPALLYLNPGEWLRIDKSDGDEEVEKKTLFYKHIVKWINSFDPLKPVLLVTSCFQYDEISSNISKPGAFDRYFNIPNPSFTLCGEEFIEELGESKCGPSILKCPDKLGKLLETSYSRRELWDEAVLYMTRLHRRVKRPLTFSDLMHMDTHGFGEDGTINSADESIRKRVAIHEAGHALMIVIDSDGNNFPEYCSIVPGADFAGIVAQSIDYIQSTNLQETYYQFRHQVRVCLAGRAAEEIFFGAEQISNGPSSDLESAARYSYKAFSSWGFCPNMGDAGMSASNVSVIFGNPTPSESIHVESLIRRFLTDEYAHVLNTLGANRSLLIDLAEHLIREPIVNQEELKNFMDSHKN